ncbi:MAG TPA: tetratricopeptide repeat protein, partial [Polyangiaceae bacterium LLY-WYZ-15_(1-7)]|nr:tetratricopeptide repeat protein [Polyangiaceae bacterium LLY-WYZ-15_(1-7)]
MSETGAIVMLRALFALSLLAAACGPSTAALPPPATAHNAAGVRHLGAGDLDAAEARFRIALEYHPRFVEARANLGAVALERGELAEAERHLRLAVHLDPEFDEAWANLGVLHARRGELEAAAEALETALAIDPGLTDARRNLGDVWIRLGRFAEARAQLMRLVELHAAPSAPWARASALLAYCE